MSYLGALLSALLHLAVALLLASGLLVPDPLPEPAAEIPIEIVSIERVVAEAPQSVEPAELPPPQPLAEAEPPPPQETAELPPAPEALAEPEALSEIEPAEAEVEAELLPETGSALTHAAPPIREEPVAETAPSPQPEIVEPEPFEPSQAAKPPPPAETADAAPPEPSEPPAAPAPPVAIEDAPVPEPVEVAQAGPALHDTAEAEARSAPPVPAPKPPAAALAEAILPKLGDPAESAAALPETASVEPSATRVATSEASDEALPDRPLDELESLVALIQQQIRPCWKGAGVKEVLRVDVSLNPDGSIGSLEMPDWSEIAGDSRLRDAANRAFDAIRACSPFRLPEDKYALWRALRFRMHAES